MRYPKNSHKIECYLGFSVLDKKISELNEPSKSMGVIWVKDKGEWVGKPI
jgi:hypothetical protein